jgi:hypothetical protein
MANIRQWCYEVWLTGDLPLYLTDILKRRNRAKTRKISQKSASAEGCDSGLTKPALAMTLA